MICRGRISHGGVPFRGMFLATCTVAILVLAGCKSDYEKCLSDYSTFMRADGSLNVVRYGGDDYWGQREQFGLIVGMRVYWSEDKSSFSDDPQAFANKVHQRLEKAGWGPVAGLRIPKEYVQYDRLGQPYVLLLQFGCEFPVFTDSGSWPTRRVGGDPFTLADERAHAGVTVPPKDWPEFIDATGSRWTDKLYPSYRKSSDAAFRAAISLGVSGSLTSESSYVTRYADARVLVPVLGALFSGRPEGPMRFKTPALPGHCTTGLDRYWEGRSYLRNMGSLLRAELPVYHLNAVKSKARQGGVYILDGIAGAESADGDGDTRLHLACRAGKATEVRSLLASGATLDAVDERGFAPLHYAARNGHADIVSALLGAGAKVDVADKRGASPLHHASTSDTVKVLLAAGAKLSAVDKSDWTPLHAASNCGRADVVKALLQAGARVDATNSDGFTPLHRAANAETVNALLAANAKIGALTTDGWTPIHIASNDDCADVVKALLSAGAKVDVVDKENRTPLHFASMEGHADVAKVLLWAGADVNAVVEKGWTPLHMAVRYGNVATVKTLLAAGANTRAVNSGGLTPLRLAKQRGYTEKAAILHLASQR